MLLQTVKESVIRRRVHKMCENLDIAEDVKATGETVIGFITDIYKGPLSSLPIIEEAIKRHPDEIADIVIEGDKIADSLVNISNTIVSVFDAEKGLAKDLEVAFSPTIKADKKMEAEINSRGKKIERNLNKLKKILTGK